LSPVEITTSMPCAAAWRASVPITSSASTPSTIRIGQPQAATPSWIGSICRRRSSGIDGRLALYSGYQSSRKGLALGVENAGLVGHVPCLVVTIQPA
jgi:hypothetical protein